MEHRILLGGEEYLPFARSCVTKLKALGLSYASQAFEVGGVSINVRIEPGHEYIRIEGGKCLIPMESGIVDVFALGEFNPGTYLPGKLYDTAATEEYKAKFTESVGVGVDANLINLGKTNAGQIAGLLTSSEPRKLRGAIPVSDVSEAFSRATEETSPGVFSQLEIDEALTYRKMVAVYCPASVFTGRTRMYVQAMYGQPMYKRAADGSTKQSAPTIKLVMETSAAPALRIAPYVSKADKDAGIEYDEVMIDTRSGLYLDKRGDHWLFQINSGYIRVYPLKSTKCGESLRKYLKQDTAGVMMGTKEKMTPVDIERLEAYILSTALPDVKNMAALGSTGTIGSYSMGYGWHWNWSGDTADIVVTESISNDANIYAGKMRSAHHRMSLVGTVDADGKTTFEATISTVEPWTQWAVLRAWWCITEPDYSHFTLSKMTPKMSELEVCDAPFYAFYTRDDLKVCRVIVNVSSAEATREMTPHFDSSEVPFVYGSENMTVGMSDGSLEDRGVAESFNAQFMVGSYSTSVLKENYNRAGYKVEVSGKAATGQWTTGFTSDGLYTYANLLSGEQPFGSTTASVLGPPPPGGNSGVSYSYGSTQRITYNLDHTSYTTSENGYATVVIPFHDAECVYIWTDIQKTRSGSTYRKHCQSANEALTAVTPRWVNREGTKPYTQDSSGTITWVENTTWASGTPTLSDFVLSEETILEPMHSDGPNVSTQVVVTRLGVTPALFGTQQEFHANVLDEVGETYMTWTGAGLKPVLTSSGRAQPQNVAEGVIIQPVIVGYT